MSRRDRIEPATFPMPTFRSLLAGLLLGPLAGSLAWSELASAAPPEAADVVVRVRDLGGWWDAPTLRRATDLVEDRLADSDLGSLWRDLAVECGVDGEELARRLLAEEFLFGLVLDGGTAESRRDWFAVMTVAETTRRSVLGSLPLRPLGGGRFELRGHDLVLVDRPPRLVAGTPAMVSRLPAETLLAGDEGPEIEIELRRGLAAAPMRIEARIAPRGVEVTCRQPGRGGSTDSTLSIDGDLRRALEQLKRHHAVVVATVAGGPSPIGLEWIAVLPEAAVPPVLGRCVRERRVWTIGETCGDARDRLRSHATPAAAVAFEVDDPDEAVRRLGAWAESLAAAIDRRFEGLALPRVEVLRTVDGGTVPLASVARALLGGHELARRVRVDWTSAKGPSGAWALVGTGATYLRDVRDAFEPPLPIPGEPPSEVEPAGDAGNPGAGEWRLVQTGWIDADRVCEHLAGWRDRGGAVFGPEAGRVLRRGLEGMLEVGRTFGRAHWTVEENASGDRAIEIRLEPAQTP